MDIFIRNMVCDRCKLVVKRILQDENLSFSDIELGKVELINVLTNEQKSTLKEKLSEVGFELLDDRKAALVTQIKRTVIELIHGKAVDSNMKLSAILSDRLNMDYNHLSSLFSSVEGTTIEQFSINQKIERVKELLIYDELTVNEIAWELGYSSVQHLSGQFKKVTGMTPTAFKQLKEKKRKPLDKV